MHSQLQAHTVQLIHSQEFITAQMSWSRQFIVDELEMPKHSASSLSKTQAGAWISI
jgi:hypothetical protein